MVSDPVLRFVFAVLGVRNPQRLTAGFLLGYTLKMAVDAFQAAYPSLQFLARIDGYSAYEFGLATGGVVFASIFFGKPPVPDRVQTEVRTVKYVLKEGEFGKTEKQKRLNQYLDKLMQTMHPGLDEEVSKLREAMAEKEPAQPGLTAD